MGTRPKISEPDDNDEEGGDDYEEDDSMFADLF